jgi:CRP-like cAMP-binding protein
VKQKFIDIKVTSFKGYLMDPYNQLIEHFRQIVKINEHEEQLIRENYSIKEFKKNELILFKGEISSYMRFIVEGCIKTYTVDEEAKEHIIHFGIEGWWINDLYSYLTKTPSTQFIEALENGKLLQIHRDKLEILFNKSQAIERFYRLKFQKAYVSSIDRSLNSISKSAEERYFEFCNKYRDIEQRVPQYLLASYLGITPEFLSLLRKKQSKSRN